VVCIAQPRETRVHCKSEAEFHDNLARGIERRKTSKTAMNDRSSRSHCIITLSVRQNIKKKQNIKDQSLEGDKQVGREYMGQLVLVDLAGNERDSARPWTSDKKKREELRDSGEIDMDALRKEGIDVSLYAANFL